MTYGIELWAFPVGVTIGYLAIFLKEVPMKETTGFVLGVWFMYIIAWIWS